MLYYNTNPGQPQFVSPEWIKENTSLDPSTATPEQLAAAGYYLRVVVPEGGIPSQNVQVVQTNEIVGTDYVITQTAIPYSADTYIKQCRSTAYDLLVPSDWLEIRQGENGTPIPTDWGNWRENIRIECQVKVDAINAATTEEELTTYVLSVAYTTWPPAPLTPAEDRPEVAVSE